MAHAQTRVSPQFLHIFRPLIYWSIFSDYSLHWKEYCRLLLSSSSVSVWVCQSSVGQLLSLRVTESFFLLFTSHFPSFLLSISLSLSNVRSGGVIACFPPFQLIQIIVFIQYSLPYTKTSCCTQWNVVPWRKKKHFIWASNSSILLKEEKQLESISSAVSYDPMDEHPIRRDPAPLWRLVSAAPFSLVISWVNYIVDVAIRQRHR